ncbi:MAG: DUF1002 domain-containing protein [Lachnospiraceae bacterium]|nr:DUF1002 domain-containing protein [Lachnospiraceae bacterium]
MKKCISMLGMICLLICLSGMTAFASGEEGKIVNIDTSKPFIALGADLTEDQKATVLELMGLSLSDLDNYNVVYVTNEEEHKYLDAYVSPSVIGTRSLSSVLVTPAEKGHGVVVSTKNIDYCTTGMYRNALLTAGVEDADILVVGPTNLSGTAGLIGALRAYEELTGEEVDDTVLDTALNELVATGEIANKSMSNEDVEALVAFIKEKIAAGELETEDDIRKAISDGEETFDVSLSDSDKEQIVQVMLKVKQLNLDPNMLLDQAAGLYDKYGDDIVNHLQDEGFFDSLGNFFQNLGKSIGSFFSELFS